MAPRPGSRPLSIAWCFEPDKESGPDPSRTRTCRPLALGEHEEQLAPFARGPPVSRRPWEDSTMDDPAIAAAPGSDVHKKTVVACVRRISRRRPGRAAGPHLRHHDRRAAGPGRLAGRPRRHPRRHGIDRRLLEAGLQPPGGPTSSVMLVNAQHIKQVPGRKTDVKDSQWIAQLLQHGLLRPSFIPPRPIRELRDLTRQRTQLVRQRATACNRIQKVLEDANIKLAGVATRHAGRLGPGHDRGADRRRATTRSGWPSWPGGGCGARSRSCARRCGAGSPSTTASCSGAAATRSTPWRA